jgi:hypothetical protein
VVHKVTVRLLKVKEKRRDQRLKKEALDTVMNSLWNTLWTCLKTGCTMNEPID